MNYPELTELESLQGRYSDFYKDVHGFRPRFASDEQWNSIAWLEGEIQGLHDYLKRLDETPEGRRELRSMGFVTSDKVGDAAWGAWDAMENDIWDAIEAQDAQDRADAVLEDALTEPEQIQAEYDAK